MTATIAIIGGGFAGVKCAKTLSQARLDAELVLFNHENHMVFQPLLADVAGSSLNPRAVAAPLRQMLSKVHCRSEEVVRIDPDERIIWFKGYGGEEKSLRYDELVIAVGNRVDMTRVPGMLDHALPLKTIGDAIAMRSRVMQQMELADAAEDVDLKRWLASFAVIGGGFSGVEVAGEINDLIRHSLKYYPNITVDDISITLIHSRDKILPEVKDKLRDFALEKMKKHGVLFELNARAKAVTRKGVTLSDGRFVSAATVICTVGNTTTSVVQKLDVAKERGRLLTKPSMQLEAHDNVWAIGDCSWVPNQYNGEISPPTAQFAERQGKQAAQNIIRKLQNKPPKPFYFKPVGVAAGIGGRSGVAELMGMRISGFVAWWLWRSAFLVKLPSMIQKIKVGLEWAWEVVFPRDINHFRPAKTSAVAHTFFAEGETIFDSNTLDETLYIIRKGECELVAHNKSASGRERVLIVFGRGEMMGSETVAAFGEDRCFLRARCNVEMVIVPRDTLQEISGLVKPIERLLKPSEEHPNSYWRKIPGARTVLESGICSQLMKPAPERLFSADDTVLEVFKQLREHRLAYGLVTDGDQVCGVITRTDLISGLDQGMDAPIRQVMSGDPICACMNDPLATAAAVMHQKGLKWMPVIETASQRTLAGILEADDVLGHVLTQIET